MNELRRILSNKRRLILLLALPFLIVALFLFERMGGDIKAGAPYLFQEASEYKQNVSRFAAMRLEEATADHSENYQFDERGQPTLRSTKLHIATYADYLDGLQEQAKKMSNSSIFGNNKNTFTYRNIQKTARDFEALSGVTPKFGGNRAVEKWVDFRIADVAYLFVMLLLVLAFFEDRQNGLLTLVRSCPAGRKKLTLSRLVTLFIGSLSFTVLLYTGTLAVSFALYGGTDTLSHAVQSIELFRTCTLRITIGEWIGLYLVAKVLCGFLIGLIFWFVLSFLSQTQLAWIAILAILGAEYAAWAFIPPQMALSVFHHVNIFSFVFPADALGKYTNMNFFGLPVGVLDLLTVLFLLLSVTLSVGILRVSAKRHPIGNRDYLGCVISFWNRLADILRSRFSITVMEGYKQLVLGGAVIFLIAAVILSPKLNWVGYSQESEKDSLFLQYLNEVSGPITEATHTYIEKASANVENYQGTENFDAAISKLKSEVKQREMLASQGGFAPWLLDQTQLSETFGKDSVSIHRWNAIVASLIVILCTAPLFPIEKRFGTEILLRSTLRGRKAVFKSKYVILILEVLAVFVIIYTRQAILEIRYLGTQTLHAPIRNWDMFADSALNISTGAFVGILFTVRFIMLLSVGLITAFISSHSKSWEQAALVTVALIVMPGVLFYFSSEWVGCISVIPGICAIDILSPTPYATALRIGTMIVLLISIGTLYHSHRNW